MTVPEEILTFFTNGCCTDRISMAHVSHCKRTKPRTCDNINLEEEEYEDLCVHKQRWSNNNENETMNTGMMW
jgi:hypothetical protein